jgi:hypothetical protein
MRKIISRTACIAESTTESRSAISHTFHNVAAKRNTYQFIKYTPTPTTDVGVALMSAVQYIMLIKDSEGSTLVSAHVFTVYAV